MNCDVYENGIKQKHPSKKAIRLRCLFGQHDWVGRFHSVPSRMFDYYECIHCPVKAPIDASVDIARLEEKLKNKN